MYACVCPFARSIYRKCIVIDVRVSNERAPCPSGRGLRKREGKLQQESTAEAFAKSISGCFGRAISTLGDPAAIKREVCCCLFPVVQVNDDYEVMPAVNNAVRRPFERLIRTLLNYPK